MIDVERCYNLEKCLMPKSRYADEAALDIKISKTVVVVTAMVCITIMYCQTLKYMHEKRMKEIELKYEQQ